MHDDNLQGESRAFVPFRSPSPLPHLLPTCKPFYFPRSFSSSAFFSHLLTGRQEYDQTGAKEQKTKKNETRSKANEKRTDDPGGTKWVKRSNDAGHPGIQKPTKDERASGRSNSVTKNTEDGRGSKESKPKRDPVKNNGNEKAATMKHNGIRRK